MAGPSIRTLRFLGAWLFRRAAVEEREVVLAHGDERLPATLLRPRSEPASAAWIALHGVTRPGRRHTALLRFARALAASGAEVLLPEIREWMELRLAPERTVPVTRACVDHFERRGAVGDRPGLVGFSFGAPQALRAAADPALRHRLGGVVGFGAYFDLERTFRFQLTGEHELGGERERLDPDPYGRWIIAANYLTDVSEHRQATDVAHALRRLAEEAGDRQISADDPALQPLRRDLRCRIPPARRSLFDLFAPTPGHDRDEAQLDELARRVAKAARRAAPELDVRRHLDRVACPVELIHGRDDRLIPYSETLRLRDAFADDAPVNVLITGLFSHSRERPIRARVESVREGWRFFRALRRVLTLA